MFNLLKKNKVYFFLAGFTLLIVRNLVVVVLAESIGDVLTVPIRIQTSEPVTAADLTILVTGGELLSVECGGSVFEKLISDGSNCVVFDTKGGTRDGVVAKALVKADQAGTLTVSVKGTLSTADGIEPSSWSINGAVYQIDESGDGGSNANRAMNFLLVIASILMLAGAGMTYFWFLKKQRVSKKQEEVGLPSDL